MGCHQTGDKPLSETLMAGMIPGLRPANERQRYFVATSQIGWAQA